MKNYNAQWYYAEKMMRKPSESEIELPKFNAIQKAFIIKHLREFSIIREAMQREVCSLSAYKMNCDVETISLIRNSFLPNDEIYNIRRQLSELRELAKNSQDIVKEIRCLGSYIHHVISDDGHQNKNKFDNKRFYVIRIYGDGFAEVRNPDKISEFITGTYIMNTENLKQLKKSIVHIKSFKPMSEPIARLKWKNE